MTDRQYRHATRATREASQAWADEAGRAGSNLFENTREFAAQALERAANRMRDLREGMADTATAAQRHVGSAADATRRYVADQPMRSALVAAAVGAVIAVVVLQMRQRNSRY